METTLNIPVGLRYTVQPWLRGYHPINDGQESSSSLITWIIGLFVILLFIVVTGITVLGHIHSGLAVVISVLLGCIVCCIWEGLNWNHDFGWLRKICGCRDAEIHTPEQPSPSQQLLQPTLQEPVPEPPTLQEPVPEPPTLQEPVPEPPTLQEPVPEPPTLQEPVPRPPTLQEPVPEP
ncbi:unnamed protein product [Larinioides sclopetarius]|uniref:Uncharacterized protein n=1 Tax=Larinioides sclopetarius TaxID=280406 RepID=A0AAV2B407_9ARAC